MTMPVDSSFSQNRELDNTGAVAGPVALAAIASGVAFVPSATLDVELKLVLAAAAAGSYTLAMTFATGQTVTTGSVAVALGGPPILSLRVPRGASVTLTLVTITLASSFAYTI